MWGFFVFVANGSATMKLYLGCTPVRSVILLGKLEPVIRLQTIVHGCSFYKSFVIAFHGSCIGEVE